MKSVGMFVAHVLSVMRLTEVVTIYLAAAAPIGVAYFLNREKTSAQAYGMAIGAALVWPVTLTLMWLAREGFRGERMHAAESVELQFWQKCDHAKRLLLAALHEAEDAARAAPATNFEAARHVLFNAREAIERFIGLTLAAREARIDGPPSPREIELCRVAGRSGDDLTIAGRCTHRRNVARLLAHRQRARAEVLHALAEVGEIPGSASFALQSNAEAAQHFSEAALEVYQRAVDLLSLFDDDHATTVVARLLDTERARRRRLESSGIHGNAPRTGKGTSWTTSFPSNSPAAPLSQKPRLTQG